MQRRALKGARSLDWRPGSVPLVHGDACAPMELASNSAIPVRSPAVAVARRPGFCQERTWHSLSVFREVRGDLSEHMLPVMVLGTWGDLAGCDALCEGTAFLHSERQEAIEPWPRGPDRSTPEAAQVTLDSAIADLDLGVLLQCVSPELRDGLMVTWRREGRLFWRLVSELLRTNGPDPAVAWQEVEEGLWMLAPR